MNEEERATAWICDRFLLFPLTSTLPFDTLRCWQRSAHGLAALRYLPKLTITPRSVSDNPDKPALAHRQSGSPWQRLCPLLSLLDWWYPLLGLASRLWRERQCYAIHTLLRPKAEHGDRGSSAHTSLRNPSLAIWGVAVTVGSGFLQWGWFKISKVQIWSASFFFFLFSAGSNIPTSFPWKISLRANHTATLSCNCEYRSCGFSLIFSPLRGTHCVSHAANDARHVHMTNGCTRANAEPCPRVSSGGVLLYTCSLSSPHPPQPETSCQWDQERHWLLRLCICHRSVDNQGDKWCWGREIKTLLIFVWHKAWKKTVVFGFLFVCVCVRANAPTPIRVWVRLKQKRSFM